jgi:hypothetical protein
VKRKRKQAEQPPPERKDAVAQAIPVVAATDTGKQEDKP